MIAIARLDARPELLDVVAGWLHGEWARHRGEPRAAVRERLAARGRGNRAPLAWVATLHGVPAGTASLVEQDDPAGLGRTLCIADLLVAPACRGRGVGSALCRHALGHARRHGLGAVHLFTVGREAYFRRRGWQRVMDAAVAVGPRIVLACYMRAPAEAGADASAAALSRA